jgi:hypothetical protein
MDDSPDVRGNGGFGVILDIAVRTHKLEGEILQRMGQIWVPRKRRYSLQVREDTRRAVRIRAATVFYRPGLDWSFDEA